MHIPQLDLSVRLPLTELRQGENETMIDLRKVRDSALALLHRHGGLHWHTRSVGLCWKYNDAMDWVVRPDSTQPTNLIEPRLIEKVLLHHMTFSQFINMTVDACVGAVE